MAGEVRSLLSMLVSQLMADKKKSAVLGLLAIMLVIVSARLFLPGTPPAPVAASVAPASGAAQPSAPQIRPQPQPVSPTPDRASESRQPGSLASGISPRATEDEREHSGEDARAAVTANMPRTLARDPFAIESWRRFQPVVSSGPDAAGSDRQGRRSFWQELQRSVRAYRRARRQELMQLEAELSELKLQFTMTGTDPVAHISGRIVRVGDEISGFSVLRIEDRRVTLRKGGHTRTLEMR